MSNLQTLEIQHYSLLTLLLKQKIFFNLYSNTLFHLLSDAYTRINYLLTFRMFDFQNLDVYKKAKIQHKDILELLETKVTNKTIKDQLSRASVSILLNIAEGTGRFTNADKRNFYVIARSSVFECVALLEILLENKIVNQGVYDKFFGNYEELSKMLYGLVKSLK